MAPADAAVLDLPQQAPSRRFHAMTAAVASEEIDPRVHQRAMATPMRVVAVESTSSRSQSTWIPAPEAAPIGLGPSVAELTLGRPPRAPRPGE